MQLLSKTLAVTGMIIGTLTVSLAGEKAPNRDQPDTLHTKPFGRFQGQRITLKNAAQLTLVAEHKDYVWKIVWSPDGKRVAFVHWEGPVEIRDGRNFRLLQKFTTKRGPIHFAFGSKPDIVAYCENTKFAKIHNLKTGKSITLQSGNSQPQMKFSVDGKTLATGGYGTAVKLWRVSDGALLKTLKLDGREGGLSPVFDPEEEFIAVGNRNDQTAIYNAATGKKLRNLPKTMTQEIAFSPGGQTLACTYVDGSLGLWSVTDGRQQVLKKTKARELYTVAWSPDGRLLATAGSKGKITVWNAQNLKILKELESPEWVISVRFTPDGTRLLASGGDRKNRRVFLFGVRRKMK